MTLKELYESVGGDYEDISSRFGNDEMIEMFVDMFAKEPSFGLLKEAMGRDDMADAFTQAHTLKGVSANIAFTRLKDLASELTELLRNGKDTEGAKALFPQVQACYEETIQAINTYKERK